MQDDAITILIDDETPPAPENGYSQDMTEMEIAIQQMGGVGLNLDTSLQGGQGVLQKNPPASSDNWHRNWRTNDKASFFGCAAGFGAGGGSVAYNAYLCASKCDLPSVLPDTCGNYFFFWGIVMEGASPLAGCITSIATLAAVGGIIEGSVELYRWCQAHLEEEASVTTNAANYGAFHR